MLPEWDEPKAALRSRFSAFNLVNEVRFSG
jgi:hypothetical protein